MRIADDLMRIAKGEVLDDSWSRQIYSVDASHYEVSPGAIICPLDTYDVENICEYGSKRKVPITARGAGTGLLGQSLSSGIVIDFARHMNRVIEIEDDYVAVQPGIVKGVLDKELKKRNKFFPPDPASSNYCTIGGMIADNSSGAHCLSYGSTIDFLEAVNVVYADGERGFASENSYDTRMTKLRKLLRPYADIIRNSYPKVSKNSCGYRLDKVISDKFLPHKIFAASEGSLGIVTSARFRIIDIPTFRCIIVFGFEDLMSAVHAVPAILQFSPAALEMLDHTAAPERTDNVGCLLFVEFDGNDKKVEGRMKSCKDELVGRCVALESASDEQSMTKIWGARRAALNGIMKLTVGSRKPIGLIEDTVVPPRLLSDHVSNLLQTYHENKLEYVMYGHVGDGNVHTRPIVDLSSKKEMELVKKMAHDTFSRVIKCGGTITGEHGDGLGRVDYIENMYGKQLANVFLAVKKLVDPNFTLNPGKKVRIQ